jgi:hypothetical protein
MGGDVSVARGGKLERDEKPTNHYDKALTKNVFFLHVLDQSGAYGTGSGLLPNVDFLQV